MLKTTLLPLLASPVTARRNCIHSPIDVIACSTDSFTAWVLPLLSTSSMMIRANSEQRSVSGLGGARQSGV